MPMVVLRGRTSASMRERGLELLAAVGLADRAEARINQLSGGQQQRVALARALALDPPFVLADEPTGNLDTTTSHQVFDLFRRFHGERRTPFLIVTHDERLASSQSSTPLLHATNADLRTHEDFRRAGKDLARSDDHSLLIIANSQRSHADLPPRRPRAVTFQVMVSSGLSRAVPAGHVHLPPSAITTAARGEPTDALPCTCPRAAVLPRPRATVQRLCTLHR